MWLNLQKYIGTWRKGRKGALIPSVAFESKCLPVFLKRQKTSNWMNQDASRHVLGLKHCLEPTSIEVDSGEPRQSSAKRALDKLRWQNLLINGTVIMASENRPKQTPQRPAASCVWSCPRFPSVLIGLSCSLTQAEPLFRPTVRNYTWTILFGTSPNAVDPVKNSRSSNSRDKCSNCQTWLTLTQGIVVVSTVWRLSPFRCQLNCLVLPHCQGNGILNNHCFATLLLYFFRPMLISFSKWAYLRSISEFSVDIWRLCIDVCFFG